MTSINEQVNVAAFFKGSKLLPYLFFWRGRRIKIDEINLVHNAKAGDATLHYFSVSSGGSFFRLKFDQKELRWELEQVEEG